MHTFRIGPETVMAKSKDYLQWKVRGLYPVCHSILENLLTCLQLVHTTLITVHLIPWEHASTLSSLPVARPIISGCGVCCTTVTFVSKITGPVRWIGGMEVACMCKISLLSINFPGKSKCFWHRKLWWSMDINGYKNEQTLQTLLSTICLSSLGFTKQKIQVFFAEKSVVCRILKNLIWLKGNQKCCTS